ncbi:MAG TPA: acyl carrier protein [Vicinamibacterales bacterium]|nr:acyl carrier protein [Vicinamibacterales bacterium]
MALVADVVEIDPARLTRDTPLADIGWDSLAVVSFIAAADERFGKTIAPKKLAACQSVRDLAALIEATD